MPLDTPTPAHERLVEDLLAWEAPRPVGDPALADRLRQALDDGLAPLVDRVPAGERLFLSKSRVQALVCDGRYLDQRESPFTWSPQLAGGKLAHRAIELDQGAGREVSPDRVVAHAWQEMATEVGSLAQASRMERHGVDERLERDAGIDVVRQAYLTLSGEDRLAQVDLA